MKKNKYFIACFVLMIVFANTTKAQGNNLQFNSAVHYTYTWAGDGNSTSNLLYTTTLVVPANKVLKIESCGITGLNATGGYVGGSVILIENVVHSGGRDLPAGTYSVKISDTGVPTATVHYAYITGILYNIVP